MPKYIASKGVNIIIVLFFAVFIVMGLFLKLEEEAEGYLPLAILIGMYVVYITISTIHSILKKDDKQMIEEIKKEIENEHRVEEYVDDEYINN